MSQAIIEIKILRDNDLNPIGVEYNIRGLKPNSWLGIFLNDIEVFRFKTNVNGEKIGSINTIPQEFHNNLIALGDFRNTYRLSEYVPESGIIAGIGAYVGFFPDDGGLLNVGQHNIDLRYL